MAQPVKVAVRARPLTEREKRKVSQLTLEMTPRSVRLFDPKGRHSAGGVGPMVQDDKEFSYDYCYWSCEPDVPNFASQEKVYSDFGPSLLTGAFTGYNACVLAYGQTGSGKTYTMMGKQDDPGVIPRLCEALFREIDQLQSPEVSYRTSVSFLEIYNERIGDLLNVSSSKKVEHSLKVREHPVTGPYVPDLTSHPVADCKSMLKLLKKGNATRATGSTQMNDSSSRSHAVFIISFKKACFAENSPSETTSHISLVDLAGSERAKDTGATGARLKEGNQINKSLVALGNVISALADQSKGKGKRRSMAHIPYRDSVLTWLLKDSLGGNSLTVMIAAISPSHHNYAETLSTLRYASRAKDIVNRPVVNEDSNVKLIRDLRMEISRLKSVLTAMKIDFADGQYPNAIAEQLKNLEKNEHLANRLTQEWTGQWEDIGFSKTVEDLAVKGEGVGVAVDSEVPHLVAIDNDVCSTGVMLYHLREGLTRLLGDPSGDRDVGLHVDDGEQLEFEITNLSGAVHIHAIHGLCLIDGEEVVGSARLQQGQILLIGNENIFRFNHPTEAAKLKQENSKLSPTKKRLTRQNSSKLAILLSSSKEQHSPKKLAVARSTSLASFSALQETNTSSVSPVASDAARSDWLREDLCSKFDTMATDSPCSGSGLLALSEKSSPSKTSGILFAAQEHPWNSFADSELDLHGHRVLSPSSIDRVDSLTLHAERDRLMSAAEASEKAHLMLAEEVHAALRGLDINTGTAAHQEPGHVATGPVEECGSPSSLLSFQANEAWAIDIEAVCSQIHSDNCNSAANTSQTMSDISGSGVIHTEQVSGCNSTANMPQVMSDISSSSSGVIQTEQVSRCDSTTNMPQAMSNISSSGVIQMEQVSGCNSTANMSQIISDISSSGVIQTEQVSGCDSTTNLPQTMSDISNSGVLHTEQVSGCDSTANMPQTMSDISSSGVRHTEQVSGCDSTANLPQTMSDISSSGVRHTEQVSGCDSTANLPQTMSDISSSGVRHTEQVSGCDSTANLPQTMSDISSSGVRHTEQVSGCDSTANLPQTMSDISSSGVRHTEQVSGCDSTANLPQTMSDISSSGVRHTEQVSGCNSTANMPQTMSDISSSGVIQMEQVSRCDSTTNMSQAMSDISSSGVIQMEQVSGCDSNANTSQTMSDISSSGVIQTEQVSGCDSTANMPQTMSDISSSSSGVIQTEQVSGCDSTTNMPRVMSDISSSGVINSEQVSRCNSTTNMSQTMSDISSSGVIQTEQVSHCDSTPNMSQIMSDISSSGVIHTEQVSGCDSPANMPQTISDISSSGVIHTEQVFGYDSAASISGVGGAVRMERVDNCDPAVSMSQTLLDASGSGVVPMEQVKELVEAQMRNQEELRGMLSTADSNDTLSQFQSTMLEQNDRLTAILNYVEQQAGQPSSDTVQSRHRLFSTSSCCAETTGDEFSDDAEAGISTSATPEASEHVGAIVPRTPERVSDAESNQTVDDSTTKTPIDKMQSYNEAAEMSVEQCLALLPSSVSIPSVILCNAKKTSTYHRFSVQIRIGAFQWCVERRYSEFLAQHLLLQGVSGFSTVKFPPTKWFGNKRSEFVEERRKSLEFYMELLLLYLRKSRHFNWGNAISQQDLVTQIYTDIPLLDMSFVFPGSGFLRSQRARSIPKGRSSSTFTGHATVGTSG